MSPRVTLSRWMRSLPEINERVWTPQILWKVRHRSLVVPAEFEVRIAKIRDLFPTHLATHVGIEDVEGLADEFNVLLRHRPLSISPRAITFHAKRIAASRPKRYSESPAALRSC
jgi:hypothetical protein